MFQLTRKIEYALIVLSHMNKAAAERQEKPVYSASWQAEAGRGEGIGSIDNKDKVFSIRVLAKKYGIPEMHAAKSVQLLLRAGFLESKQGVKGGYILNCQLKDLSLYDLIQAVEGPMGVVRCVSVQNHCHYYNNCNITEPMKLLNEKLIRFYKQTSLDEILAIPQPKEQV